LCGDERFSAELALTITRSGLAEFKPGASVAGFLDQVVKRELERAGGEVIRDRVNIHVDLTRFPEPDYGGYEPNPHSAFFLMEPHDSGYAVAGPALDLLSQVHPGLPVEFMARLAGACHNWFPTYCPQNACYRWEMWLDSVSEDEENPPFPIELADRRFFENPFSGRDESEADPGGWYEGKRLSRRRVRALLSGAPPSVRELFERLEALEALSGSMKRQPWKEEWSHFLDYGCDLNPPLPLILFAVRDRDAVTAAFDEEGQSWLEVQPEPSFMTEMDARSVRSVRAGFAAMRNCISVLAAALDLADYMTETIGGIRR
jgi:hypothetical protein